VVLLEAALAPLARVDLVHLVLARLAALGGVLAQLLAERLELLVLLKLRLELVLVLGDLVLGEDLDERLQNRIRLDAILFLHRLFAVEGDPGLQSGRRHVDIDAEIAVAEDILCIAVDLVRHLRIERLLLGTGGLAFLALLTILPKEFEVDGLVGVRHEGL